MAAELVSSLREAFNGVYATGYLEEMNLERGSKDNKEYIGGDIVVGISDSEKYKFYFYTPKYTKNNEVSKIYKGYETVIDTYISKAKALANNLPLDSVTKINVLGAISVNDYPNKETGEMVTSPRLKGKFVNSIPDDKEFNPEATFKLELYFENLEKELDENGSETGRVRIDGIVPIYRGEVIPVTLYTATDNSYVNVGEYLLNNYSAGKSSFVKGKLGCFLETKTYVHKGFGAPPTERTFTNYNFEFIVEDGNPEQYLITDAKNFDKQSIKSAMLYRQEKLEGKKSNSSEPSNGFAHTNMNTGFGGAGISEKTKELDF